MAKFFTSDWLAGEVAASNTHSLLRPRPTEVMVQEWLEMCHKKLSSNDDFYLLGDLSVSLDDLKIYQQLPDCHKHIILGDKEYGSKLYSQSDFTETVVKLKIFKATECQSRAGLVEINGIDWCMAHKPTDCFEISNRPALCGHVHGIWRTQCTPKGNPIINVGIDAWGQLVSEELIQHQFDAITKGYYDREARVDLWKTS